MTRSDLLDTFEVRHLMRDHFSLRAWFWIGAVVTLLGLGLLVVWYAALNIQVSKIQTNQEEMEKRLVLFDQRLLTLEKDKQAREERAKRVMEEQRKQEQKGKMP